jgi:type I restriction enzyme R subunit
LGLTEERLAFDDALGVSNSTVEGMGDKKLRPIARELVDSVRNNPSIDWTLKESGQANPRCLVNRI